MAGQDDRRARARRKAVAIAAAGIVVLAGATISSLAAWLDEEWVTAGVDGLPGVSASQFEIEQSVAADAGAWFDRETAAAAGAVDFGEVARALSPGSVAYGWVSLRAAVDSIGGRLELVPGYVDGGSSLGDALRYGARVLAAPAECGDGGYPTGAVLVPDGTALGIGSGAVGFDLAAGDGVPGAPETVCFRLELPAGASESLMGATADVTWTFRATSD